MAHSIYHSGTNNNTIYEDPKLGIKNKNITGFSINQNTLLQSGSNRQFTVTGDIGAEFLLQVFNTATHPTTDQVDFYNFITGSFTSSTSSENTLTVKMSSTVYDGSITFPTNTNGDTYTILLLTPPDKDTVLSLGNSKHSHSITIAQVANTTLTFTPITASSSNYKTFPTSVTSVSSPAIPSNATESLSWEIENTESDGHGFGLRLIRQPIDTDWYSTTTGTVNEGGIFHNKTNPTVAATTSSNLNFVLNNTFPEIAVFDYIFTTGVTLGTVITGTDGEGVTMSVAGSVVELHAVNFVRPSNEWVLDDLTGIVTGMVITAVSGTNAYLNGTPTVLAIDRDTSTITLSEVPDNGENTSGKQGFYDDITLTFQARGSNTIKKATGANIDFSGWNADVTSAVSTQLTKTARTDSSGTTVDLNGTYGIAGGNHVTVAGVGVNNASANTVVNVSSASSTAGSIVVTLAQNVGEIKVTEGTTLYFTGSTQKVTITNTIPISRNPDADRTVYLNLDNFITVGAAS